MPDLRLVIFDVDGTLVDSQQDIIGAMRAAYASEGMTPPPDSAILSIVGLSLPQAMMRLEPDIKEATCTRMVETYKDFYARSRSQNPISVTSPMYPGAREVLKKLHAEPWTLLAVATGKSRRGLTKLLEGHQLTGIFVSEQVSDHHPSKPNPSMIEACLRDTGVSPSQAVMVGDTEYDMQMAHAAGIKGIGVPWGYHDPATIGADHIIERFGELPDAIDLLLGTNS